MDYFIGTIFFKTRLMILLFDRQTKHYVQFTKTKQYKLYCDRKSFTHHIPERNKLKITQTSQSSVPLLPGP